jgi:hypothetical protein
MECDNEDEFTLCNFNNLNLEHTESGYAESIICYVYWNENASSYLLAARNIMNDCFPVELEVDLDRTINAQKLYYAKIHYFEGENSIVYVSNNKRYVCEYIINEFGIDITDGNIYYVTGDLYKCRYKCRMQSRQDIINCMMIHHNTDEFEILELNII